jgi:Ca2+-binding EF-hand superfamily protein
MFDQDDSGSINASEVKHVLKALKLRITDSDVNLIMKQMDIDSIYCFKIFLSLNS